MTRIPARLHSLMASTTSVLGGSNIPTTPTKVQLVSYLMNLPLSSRSMSSFLGGLSMVAKARQRRVSRPATNIYLVRIKTLPSWYLNHNYPGNSLLSHEVLSLRHRTCSVVLDVFHDFRFESWCHGNLLGTDAHKGTSV